MRKRNDRAVTGNPIARSPKMVLKRADELLASEREWTMGAIHGVMARECGPFSCDPNHYRAESWTLHGALIAVAMPKRSKTFDGKPWEAANGACKLLLKVIPTEEYGKYALSEFNDHMYEGLDTRAEGFKRMKQAIADAIAIA